MAATLPNRCCEEEAAKRRDIIMELQARIMDEYDERLIGKTIRVLCEDHDGLFWLGRSYADSPDVDEQICFAGDAEPGEFYNVKILNSDNGILIGEIS